MKTLKNYLILFSLFLFTFCSPSKEKVIAVTGVLVSPATVALMVGNTQLLTPTVQPPTASNQNVTWSSGNPSVATVSGNGLVTATGLGTAIITVSTVDGNKSAICTVTVDPIVVTSITLVPTTATMTLESTQQLSHTIVPSNATNKEVDWKSSNSEVVTVTDKGLVTAISTGSAIVSVTTVDGDKTASCAVEVTYDGSWYLAQPHTTGPGIDLVFMGDGYTAQDISMGKYKNDTDAAIEGFFDIQPYKAYRDYFRVFVVRAVSNVSGVGDDGVAKDTKFGTYDADFLQADLDMCFEYAQKAPISHIDKSTVILVANMNRYAGVCYAWDSGKSVSICAADPYTLSFLVQHEAGGHGFAKLADEYFQNNTPLDESQKAEILQRHSFGHCQNIDLTDDPTKVFWKDFIDNPKYPAVGIFEGGHYCSSGVWRSEDHSLMRDYLYPNYSAHSRALIVRKIKQFAGESFNMEWFISTDIVELPAPTKASIGLQSLRPLPPPIWNHK
ncbi:MAG: Ig-like domain-containing protein [Prevotellaceae bacterium]|jgi:hypothetical protein|nr:Ig-like domain-containing protein [Prevotellaceae bacterium]